MKITDGSKVVKFGKGTKHTVYTTVGNPNTPPLPDGASVPTVWRMEEAVKRMQQAYAAAFQTPPCYHKVVQQLSGHAGPYVLERSLFGGIHPVETGWTHVTGNADTEVWLYPYVSSSNDAENYDGSDKKGADCISIAHFLRNVCRVMGLPGDLQSKRYIALYATQTNTNRPHVAVEGDLNNPVVNPGGDALLAGLNPSWKLYLIDAAGNPNAFEETLVYTYNNKTKYYPAGVPDNPLGFNTGSGLCLSDTNDIIRIFPKLAWIDAENNIKATEATYTFPASVAPCP